METRPAAKRNVLESLETRILCKRFRRKWQNQQLNVKQSNVVLLAENDVSRKWWPMGMIVNSVKSADSLIRETSVRIVRNGKPYTRPVIYMVLLVKHLNICDLSVFIVD